MYSALLKFLNDFGGIVALIVVLIRYLADVSKDRLARTEKARLDERLETLKGEIETAASERLDLTNRKRGVYSDLATGMRVFVGGPLGDEATQAAAKIAFLEAYGAACVWAAESVIQSLGRFLDIMIATTDARARGEPQDQRPLKAAYIECVKEMRKDAGFADTTFEFRFVQF